MTRATTADQAIQRQKNRQSQRPRRRALARGAALVLGAVVLSPAWAASVKPPLCGLVSMGKIGFQLGGGAPDNSQREAWAHPGLYVGLAVNLRWADLEPSEGNFDFRSVEAALAEIDRYNRANPGHQARAKLRVFAGRTAPEWVVARDGGWIEMTKRDIPFAIGHFWTAAYRQAWRELQAALAARYDADPRVAEVAVSSCSTNTDEPFILQKSRADMNALHEAGFSDAAFRNCLSGALDDYAPWRLTPADFPFNPFFQTDSGRITPDPSFTLALMHDFRDRRRARAVLATHGLDTSIRPNATDIYRELAELGPPIAFQFVSPHTDFDAAMAATAAYHPTEIEVWESRDVGGNATESTTQIRSWASHLSCDTPR